MLIVPYRNPLVLAKELATIDRISHGRVVLGIGVGWMREEFDALGIDDLWSHRGAVTDEFMAACVDLWTQDGPSTFDGRWVNYRDIGANPLPVQRPHIPIWVGGKTAPAHRRVARYGSGYHTVASTPAQIAQEVAAVRAEMERAGRDPDELVVSMLWAFLATGGVQQLIDTIGAYAEAGLHHLVGVPSLVSRAAGHRRTNGWRRRSRTCSASPPTCSRPCADPSGRVSASRRTASAADGCPACAARRRPRPWCRPRSGASDAVGAIWRLRGQRRPGDAVGRADERPCRRRW